MLHPCHLAPRRWFREIREIGLNEVMALRATLSCSARSLYSSPNHACKRAGLIGANCYGFVWRRVIRTKAVNNLESVVHYTMRHGRTRWAIVDGMAAGQTTGGGRLGSCVWCLFWLPVGPSLTGYDIADKPSENLSQHVRWPNLSLAG